MSGPTQTLLASLHTDCLDPLTKGLSERKLPGYPALPITLPEPNKIKGYPALNLNQYQEIKRLSSPKPLPVPKNQKALQPKTFASAKKSKGYPAQNLCQCQKIKRLSSPKPLNKAKQGATAGCHMCQMVRIWSLWVLAGSPPRRSPWGCLPLPAHA